jgi:hypothetical protein
LRVTCRLSSVASHHEVIKNEWWLRRFQSAHRAVAFITFVDGAAERAVELIETMAPAYASYKSRPDMHPQEFSPAPYSVKGAFSSFPAYYFADYIRALRTAGDPAGADNMLRHLGAILKSRKERGLFVDGALDALEQAEQDDPLRRLALFPAAQRDPRRHTRSSALRSTDRS